MSDADMAATKFQAAKKAALVMTNILAPLPPEVALEAATMLLKGLYMVHVKPAKRLNLFNRCIQTVKAELKADLKTKREKP